MYRHLMVPVDGSALSALNVESAVRLAQKLGAEITFLYATPDLTATADGLIIRSSDPMLFESEELGETNAILNKAAASARAAAVMATVIARFSNSPAKTILQEAIANGCDLIVMATRGKRGLIGWMKNSQTEHVIRHSTIPVLVTRVESNNPMTQMERALSVISDEHRSIAAVVRGMLDFSSEYLESGKKVDLKPLAAMLSYLQKFPPLLHHPKEERYIHSALRIRAPECLPRLEILEEQHKTEHLLVEDVARCLAENNGGLEDDTSNLKNAIDALAKAIWGHMGTEEREILPLAREKLTSSDWMVIAEAFEGNNDPSFGNMDSDEFRSYFRKIADLMPEKQRAE